MQERTDRSTDPRGPRWSVRMVGRNAVVTLHRHCRPDRTLEWEEAERAAVSPAAFQRQYGVNFDTPSGSAFYPEAAERIHETGPWEFSEGFYVRRYPLAERGPMENSPILVGWDAGQLRPALVMAQYDKAAGILWYIRECRLEEMQGPDVCMLGGFLTGRFTMADLIEGPWRSPAAVDWIKREEADPFYGWPMPWLDVDRTGRRQYVDVMAQWEGNHPQSLAPSAEVNTWLKLWRQRGIGAQGRYEGWDHRETMMRFLLREGNIPGCARAVWDPSCKYGLKGLAGGLVRPTTAQKFGGPKRDRQFEDVHDCETYIGSACYPLNTDFDALELRTRQLREAAAASAPRPPAPFRQPAAAHAAPRVSIHWTYGTERATA